MVLLQNKRNWKQFVTDNPLQVVIGYDDMRTTILENLRCNVVQQITTLVYAYKKTLLGHQPCL